ncbi:MAG: thiolase family protein [Xanthobacteraceae bacterium]|nr:MAG: thiolase family protein [Xanthobacteraceae bacterium]
MTKAWIVAARRTAVAPRDGAFVRTEAHDLAAPVIDAVRADCGLAPQDVEEVILGNALYGGGNPARLAALAAALPESVAAMTLDTQCCGGLDAIALAAARVAAGERDVVVAGGVESFSRAPIRMRRPLAAGEAPRPYDRPPFTPFPGRDPDMLDAAAMLAERLGIGRAAQEAFAVESHRKALADGPSTNEIIEVADLSHDAFARDLTERLCERLPLLVGDARHGVTAATTAVEADAAAAVMVVSDRIARGLAASFKPVRILGSEARGGDPTLPGLAPVAAGRALMARLGLAPADFAAVEIMEAFAAQALACRDALGLPPARVNRGGGALARGHPIGASGAILAVRLCHELQRHDAPARGLALIAAAGGLGSALALSREAF